MRPTGYLSVKNGVESVASKNMKILFVSSTRIGDAVLSTGLLAHLVARYPDAQFTIACGPLPAPIFAHVPGCKQVIALNKQRWAGHWRGLWASVVGTAWDMVVDLRGSALSWMVWTRTRYVFRRADASLHRVEALARLFDLDDVPAPQLWWSDAEDKSAEELIPNGPPVLALGPTANWPAKVWPADRFLELATRLTGPDGILPDGRIAVFGGNSERDIALPILQAIPADRCIDLVGNVDLLTVAACLKRCKIFVGNDSGLMHIAAATGTPTLGLFGPSQSVHYAPWGPQSAVAETKIPYSALVGAPDFDHKTAGSLMGTLSVDRVASVARDLWRRAETAS
jgi:ADP-heptose:LPS heptosyltransferase